MITFLVSLFLAVIPFFCFFSCGDGIRTPKEILSIAAFAFIAFNALCSYSFKPLRIKPLIWLFLWFLLSTTINWHEMTVLMPLADKPDYAAQVKIFSTAFAWKELFYCFIAFFYIYALASIKNDKEISIKFFGSNTVFPKDIDFKVIARAVNITAISMAAYCVVQALGLDNIFRTCDYMSGFIAKTNLDGKFTHRIVGTIGNPTICGVWFAMCLPFAVYLRSKLGVAAIITAILLTFSSTAIIASVVSVLLYLFFKSKKLCAVFATIVIIAFALGHSHIKTYPKDRVGVWKESFKLIQQRPLFGYGMGTYEYIVGENPAMMEKLNGYAWREMHNEYGQVWFTSGLIGLALLLWSILAITARFLKNINEESLTLFCAFSSLCIISFPLFPFRIAPVSFYAVTVIGLLLYFTNGEKA